MLTARPGVPHWRSADATSRLIPLGDMGDGCRVGVTLIKNGVDRDDLQGCRSASILLEPHKSVDLQIRGPSLPET